MRGPIFKAYLNEAAPAGRGTVVAEYAGKLDAVDVFTIDIAFAMLESQRIDAGLLGAFGIRS